MGYGGVGCGVWVDAGRVGQEQTGVLSPAIVVAEML